MEKIISKEKVLAKLDISLKSLKKNTASILMAMSVAMHVMATISQKGFDLVNRYPDFIKDCFGIIIDSINQTAKAIILRVEAEPRLKEDVVDFIKDMEGLASLYQLAQSKITKFVVNIETEEEEQEKEKDLSFLEKKHEGVPLHTGRLKKTTRIFFSNTELMMTLFSPQA